MRYPELMIAPLRQELTRLGAEELRTPEAVDAFLEKNRDGRALLVVNSVCGCSAGSMRPALDALHAEGVLPDAFASVFAGADLEATERARERLAPYPPSSPAIALFENGEIALMLERRQIQGRNPADIADELRRGLDGAAVK